MLPASAWIYSYVHAIGSIVSKVLITRLSSRHKRGTETQRVPFMCQRKHISKATKSLVIPVTKLLLTAMLMLIPLPENWASFSTCHNGFVNNLAASAHTPCLHYLLAICPFAVITTHFCQSVAHFVHFLIYFLAVIRSLFRVRTCQTGRWWWWWWGRLLKSKQTDRFGLLIESICFSIGTNERAIRLENTLGSACACVCTCVCVWEGEREREWEWEQWWVTFPSAIKGQ